MGKYALLIGVGHYQYPDAIPPFPYARNDVEALGEVLMHPEIGGFSEVKPVFDPDRMTMEEAFEEFSRKCNRGDLSVVFFAGQGLRDSQGRACFATHSTRRTGDGQLVQATVLPVRSVHDLMSSSRARQQVMILDCGFGEPGGWQANAPDESLSLKSQLGARGRVILLASDDGSISTSAAESDLSLYTHYLIEGILTGAADQNQDGEVALHELHRYTSSKVQDALPTLHSELIALRDEDLNLNLARVPLIDPHRRYREEVERYVVDGQISPVARAILDQQRSHLHLSAAEALNIEKQVLQPFRDSADRVQRYRNALKAALETEYPLGSQRLSELRDLQQLLDLSDAVVKPIQRELMQPLAAQAALQRQALDHYERELRAAIVQEETLSDSTRQQLRQLQQTLALTDDDVQPLEQRLISQNLAHQEALRKRLHQFEQAFAKAVEAEYPLNPLQQVQLKKLQHSLELTDAQVLQAEQRVTEGREAQQASHQQNLARYQQEYSQLIAQESVISDDSRDRLQQLQHQLGLEDQEVVEVEAEAIAARQTYQDNLRRYEQALLESLAVDFLPSDRSLDELKQLQETLMLNDEDVAALRQQQLDLAEARRKARETADRSALNPDAAEIVEPEIAEATQRSPQIDRADLTNTSPADPSATPLAAHTEASFFQLPEPTAAAVNPTAAEALPPQELLEPGSLSDQAQSAEPVSVSAPPPPLPPDLEDLSDLSDFSESLDASERLDFPGISSDLTDGIGQAPAPPPSLLNEAVLSLDGSEPGGLTEQPLPALDFSDSLQPVFPPTLADPGALTSDQMPLPPTTTLEAVDHLSSERQIDYSTLQGLLQSQLWREADRETLKLMLLATDRQAQGWISPEAIASFPCTDLNTINQLWSKYTDGHFSFTAQERIYREVSGSLTDRDKAIAFGTQVKWVQKFAGIYPMFKRYEDLEPSLSAPMGHLPALWYWTLSPGAALRCGALGRTRAYGGGDIQMLSTLLNRLLDCRIL